jgi:hypothetical protein
MDLWKTHDTDVDAARRDGRGRLFGSFTRIGVLSVVVILGCWLTWAKASDCRPDVMSKGRSEPTSISPIASMARRSFSQTSMNFEKSWPKALWSKAQ